MTRLGINLFPVADQKPHEWSTPLQQEQIIAFNPNCLIISTAHRKMVERQLAEDSAIAPLLKNHVRIAFVDETFQQFPSQYLVLKFITISLKPRILYDFCKTISPHALNLSFLGFRLYHWQYTHAILWRHSLDSCLARDDATSFRESIGWNPLLDERLPRLIVILCTGASLAVAGAVTQSLFHNPLASPSILGISCGGSLGSSSFSSSSCILITLMLSLWQQ